MTSNAELARRADLALGDLTANGGLLNPEQANTFIDLVVEQPTILRQARVVRMSAPTRKINKLGFDQRIMRAATQTGGAQDDGSNTRHLAAADRSAPVTQQIELNTNEVIAEIHLHDEIFEDNIEGDSFEGHVIRLMAERAAEDFEEWLLQADTASADPYLALTDGVLKQATSNVVDNLSAGISPDLFEAGMLTMPQRFLRNSAALRQYTTVADSIRYRANVARRATGYGDSALQGDGTLLAWGVPVEQAPLMPVGFGLFTFPQNLIWGVQRDIRIETDRDIRARTTIVVLSARIDVLLDEEEAVVKYINV
jgi:hypothetical protein